MRKRDLAILKDLQRFRVLSRDDIIDLHFSHLKQPITSCNAVLKRLRRDGYIEVCTNMQPYLYFLSPAPIKKDSMKIPHFLKIVQFYKNLLEFQDPKSFIVEPKYGKGFMEPDAFMIWKGGAFFVEIQRSVYSEKVMDEKINRYEVYFMSNEWQQESWQPTNKKVFPTVLMITDTRYKIESSNIKFYQVPNVSELVNMFDHPEIKTSGSLKLISSS